MLLLDDRGRLLLLRDSDLGLEPVAHWWVTPGGGVDPGESDAQAVVRELLEETGLEVSEPDLAGPLLERTAVHGYSDKVVDQTEVFFLVRVAAFEPDTSGHTDEERRTVVELRWWSPEELQDTDHDVWPRDLDEVLALAARPERWRDGPVRGRDVEESSVPA